MTGNKYVVSEGNAASTEQAPVGVFVLQGAENPNFQADESGQPAPADQQPRDEMSKFKEIPQESGDIIRFAFLVGFPLVCFIVGVVITGLNVD